jgi:cellulose synthase/poly-beta-1,6-N-acetylglucosamine synthase-like glycosyltransferase
VPRVDVVVPAYNAAAHIGRCIAGLRAAGVSPEAIHIVDDGSGDATVSICRAAGIEPILSPANAGAAAARNLGAESSSADIVFFLDSDIVVAPDAIDVVRRFFEGHPEVSAVFGCYDDSPDHPARVSRIRNLLHRHVHLRHAGDAFSFWTGCSAVRRTAFEAVGGFHPGQAMMEDVRFGMDLIWHGYRIHLLPELQGKHLKRWTWASMVRTDLIDRAIPWSRLLLSHAPRDMPKTLNVDLSGRLSVVAVAVSLIGLMLLPIAPGTGGLVAVSALVALVAVNRSFLVMLWRLGRPLDAFVAVPVLWLHYLCAGLGFALVRAGLC